MINIEILRDSFFMLPLVVYVICLSPSLPLSLCLPPSFSVSLHLCLDPPLHAWVGYHITAKIERGLMRKELSKKIEFMGKE